MSYDLPSYNIRHLYSHSYHLYLLYFIPFMPKTEGFILLFAHRRLNEMANILQTTFYNHIFSYKDFYILIQILLQIVPQNLINSLWPSDAIWPHRTWSTLAQVMACCLMASSHYLNQCWLIISKVQSHSSGNHFTKDTTAINHWNQFENSLSKFSFKSPRDQWVNKGEYIPKTLRLGHMTILGVVREYSESNNQSPWHITMLCAISLWHKWLVMAYTELEYRVPSNL